MEKTSFTKVKEQWIADPHHEEANLGMQRFGPKEKDQRHPQSKSWSFDLYKITATQGGETERSKDKATESKLHCIISVERNG